MEPQNPYRSPASDLGGGVAAQTSAEAARITRKMLDELAGTKPWARLCSILGFIGSGLLVVAGLFMLLASGFAPAGPAPGVPGGMMMISLLYVLLAALYIVPSLHLFRYARSIQQLLDSGGEAQMERALGDQRAFWKFVGVLALVVILVYAVIFVGLLVAGALGALS